MLKETKNEESRLFCHIFICGGISVGGRPGPPGAPAPGYAYDCNFNAIRDIKILCAFLLVCSCVYVKATLMVLFRMIMLNMRYYW